MRKTFITLGVLTVIGGFFAYQYNRALNFVYEIKNFKIISFTKDELKFRFDYFIRNQSIFSYKIIRLNLKIYLNGKHLGAINSSNQIDIKGRAVAKVPVGAEINPKKAFSLSEILKILAYSLSDKDKERVVFTFKGELTIKMIKEFTVPVNIRYTLAELLKKDEE